MIGIIKFAVVMLALLVIVALAVDPVKEKEKEQRAAVAAAFDTKSCTRADVQRDLRKIIYKANGYMVYVQPSWYLLSIDERTAVALVAANCYSDGSVRIMDGRSGQLLARWSKTLGYVNEQR